jgi:hypothetical protein
MFRFSRFVYLVRNRTTMMLCLAAAALLASAATVAHAQFAPPSPTTPVHDPAPLRPPAGARVAIVEFEDLE